MSARPESQKMVVLCECGPIIRDLLDLDELGRAAAQMPGVARVERFGTLCSIEGKAWLAQKMRENPDLLPVIAACSPREHADTFEGICADAGRNPYMMSRANIREQCAWVTSDVAEATNKAIAMVAAAAARVAEQEPLSAVEVDCETSVLVIGSGVAGMTAAQLVADSGRDVVLVEREPAIGGKAVLLSEMYPEMDCAPCLLEPLMDAVLHHERIEVMTSAEVDDVLGYLGNFTALIRRHARHVDAEGCYGCPSCSEACPVEVPDEYNVGMTSRKAIHIPFPGALPNAAVIDKASCLHFNSGTCDACVAACPFGVVDLSGDDEVVERHVGAVILATGSQLAVLPGTAYDLPGVMTTWEFERVLNPDGPTAGDIRRADGRVPKTVALVHCADECGNAPSDLCSRTCCLALAKYAIEIGHKLPDAELVEYAWDRVLGGEHYRSLAAKLPPSMKMVRLTSANNLRIEPGEGGRTRVVATMGSQHKALEFDLVIMAPPHAGSADAVDLAGRMSVDVDEHGYVLMSNKWLRTSSSRVEGVYVAGSAQGEKDVPAASTQASAAAGAVLSALVPGQKLVREAATATVNEKLCGGCRICTFACPYKAISFDDERLVAVVNELLCHGCGTCSAACPSSAITARHFSDDEILAEIHAYAANSDFKPVL